MGYHYLSAEPDYEHQLPDVEVFRVLCEELLIHSWNGPGYYYAYGGASGCNWNSFPVGPYETEEEALAEARRAAKECK
jgi:hypothetical protein